MAIISGGIYLVMPFLLTNFLEKFIDGLEIIQIIIFSNCLLFSLPITTNYLLSISKKSIVLILLIIFVLFNSFAIYFAALSISISIISYAILLAYFISSNCFLYYSLYFQGYKFLESLFLSIVLNVPFIICIVTAIFINNHDYTASLITDFLSLIYVGIQYTVIVATVLFLFTYLSKIKKYI